jgi:O-antigen/teichoic acid export membrane protein
VQSIGNANLATIKKLLSFGKYTMGTLIGTNLLKSTDTFMITWFLGPAALAAYHLPYKLIELVEIPLRSLAAIFLPQAVKQTKDHNLVVVKNLFYQYTALLTIVLLPVGLMMFLFAEEMIIVLGGATYASSANIFRCFVIYSLLLPLDRFLGMTLDILHRPHLNSVKVCLMVVINMTGNLIAIHFFASPLLVAAGTIVTIAGGVMIGWFILKRILSIQVNELLHRGYFTMGQYIHRQPKSSAV